jgi:catecholate siderophore receptor
MREESRASRSAAAAIGAPPLLGVAGVCVSLCVSPAAQADGPTGSAPTDGDSSGVAADTGTALQQVTVTGVRPLVHDKLAEDELDTPQSITVVNQELMTAQSATRLEDALQNVPGITLNAGEGAARGDTVNLRGFSAFNDFFLDGVRDAAVYTRDSFDLQSLEVLKGPSAVLFGRGSTGGAINQVSKAPLDVPLDEVSSEFASNELYRATADLNAPLEPGAALRLNLMGESSQVAERDDVRNRRVGVAPALQLNLSEQDRVTLVYLHQQEDDVLDTGIPFVDGRPASVPRDAFFGLASDRATADDDIATARYQHEFSPELSLADTLRAAAYQFDYQFEAPNFGANVPTAATPLDSVQVGRDAPDSSGLETNLDEQLDLTARFDTGFIAHTLVTGIEIARQSTAIDRYVNPFNSDSTWIPETPLLDPDPSETRPSEPVGSRQLTVAPSGGLYALDTMRLNRYVDLTAGFRYDYFSARYNQMTYTSGAQLQLQQLNRLGSPRAALVVKPTPQQSYYFSFGTSFDPSAEALALTTKTADLGPVKANTYELGTKSQWLDGGLELTGALFRTEVDNAQTNDPDNPTITVLNGNERVDGLEVGANGHLTQHWELVAGYTYLDGRTLASGTATDVGKLMPNTAHNSLNLWTEYQLSSRWKLGGGGNWLSYRYADSGELAYVPGYVVWNAMASCELTPGLTLQLNGFNLFNKLYYGALYYTSPAENHAIPGAGRSAALTLRLRL